MTWMAYGWEAPGSWASMGGNYILQPARHAAIRAGAVKLDMELMRMQGRNCCFW